LLKRLDDFEQQCFTDGDQMPTTFGRGNKNKKEEQNSAQTETIKGLKIETRQLEDAKDDLERAKSQLEGSIRDERFN